MSDPDALASISELLGTSLSDVKAEFNSHFEKLAHQIAERLDEGPHLLIENASFRLLCRRYCGPCDPYSVDKILLAIGAYMKNELHMSPEDRAELWGPETQALVRKAIDRDNNKEVST